MMMAWMKGTIARRWPALALTGAGLAVTTALIGVILVFAVVSSQSMTRRALSGLPVDWQVAVQPGGDVASLAATLDRIAGVTAVRSVGYAAVTGFEAMTDGTTQTTGAGMVLGIPADYAATFPGQLRPLLGSPHGVLLAQQTAANLHVGIGQSVSILRSGQAPVAVTVEGVVELPNADAMFQTIGPAKRATAAAPPDNVMLMPAARWTALFGGPDARWQLHARLDHASLPPTPGAAYLDATGRARHVEVATAGAATIGDNLAARLDAVRTDALFSGMLLLVLGLPGIVLALLLTIAILRTQADRQRQQAALLGLRGASMAAIVRIVAAEGVLVAGSGAVAGSGLAALVAATVLGAGLGDGAVLTALAIGLGAGLLLAGATVLVPTIAQARGSTVALRRAMLPATTAPTLWQRLGADIALLAVAALLFWRVANGGYQVVLAPEGVAATSVDPTAFLVPLCLWVGAGLLALRGASGLLALARPGLAAALSPVAGRMALPVAASLVRQRRRIARHAALATLAVAFATSLVVFAATYQEQALVDARLTNGADVTITGSAASPAGDRLALIKRQPGVAAAEPMQHRFAYVGNDLQDLYGIDAVTIGRATDIADAYVADHDAAGTLQRLARKPDGVLLSQETVNDFQLALGDAITLRLQAGPDHAFKAIPFHFVGVVSEFPTAPRDSFLVANSAYVAAETGDAQAEVVLVRGSDDPARVGAAIRAALGPASSLKVTDLAQAGRIIGSSLAAVDLRSLVGVEGVFAALLVAGATGLILWLGLSDRRAQSATLAALGASTRQVRLPAVAEAAIVALWAGLGGWALGEIVALVLVKLLGGAFDPPPDVLQQPWSAFAAVLAIAVLSFGASCLKTPSGAG